ncbi:hypothetical protein EDD11_002323 [Mortierella claussenii]|nr:hypothetical protein EDD11_002323 [Mortierella claussenii]
MTGKGSHFYTFHTSAPKSSRSSKNHYEQLGLSKDATKKEIKSQFYKLSKLHHPDKNDSTESRKQFLSINEAYSILGNDRQRRDYDLTLLDKTGSLYSSSSDSSQRSASSRGTLRRTPFRHSAQSAAAAAAARSHAAFRPNVGARAGGGPVPHFDAKSHQEMHYEQEIRREERRQARERASADYREQKQFEESDSTAGKVLRVSFMFVAILLITSFSRAFADEVGHQLQQEEDKAEVSGARQQFGRLNDRQKQVLDPDRHDDDGRITVDIGSSLKDFSASSPESAGVL